MTRKKQSEDNGVLRAAADEFNRVRAVEWCRVTIHADRKLEIEAVINGHAASAKAIIGDGGIIEAARECGRKLAGMA